MSDGARVRRVPLAGAVTAPQRALGAALAARLLAVPFVEVPCPGCGEACALLNPRTRLLVAVTRDGGIGAPLAARHTDNAEVRCVRCGWHGRDTCGRAVFYRWRSGRADLLG